MWEPLVIGKFGERYYKTVNMAWMWARIKARTTRLGTFEGGFQNFADLFAEKLRGMGVEIRLSAKVKSIKRDQAAGRLVVQSDHGAESFDKVLVTTSPALMARLSPELPKAYLEGLLKLESMGAVVMVLSLKQQLSEEGYYWYNIPKSAGFPFLAVVEHTNFVPKEKFGGDTIVYIGDYLEPDHEYFKLSDEELLKLFAPHLKKFNPRFEMDWVKKVWVFKTSLCPAGAAGESLEEHPGHPDAGGWAVLCLDEPGLPVGPRHELRGGDRPARGADDDGKLIR